MEIVTDHKFRNILCGYELTEKEKKEFDYIELDEFNSHDFFRYKGRCYGLDEFMEITNSPDIDFSKYDGYSSDSFFSGILIKYSEDMESIKVARYYS